MSCECTSVCSVSRCVELLTIGTIDPDTTVIVQFKDIITGRIKQVNATSDENGLLIADVSTINTFFSESFVYEISLLGSNVNQCNTTNFFVGETEVSCIRLTFAAYENSNGTLVINDPIIPEFDTYLLSEEGDLLVDENNDNLIE